MKMKNALATLEKAEGRLNEMKVVDQIIGQVEAMGLSGPDDDFEPDHHNYKNLKYYKKKEYSIGVNNDFDNSASTWDFAGKRTVILPHSLRGVVNAVKYAEKKGKKLRALGSRHSFSNTVQTDDLYLDLCNTYTYCIEKHNETLGTLDQEPRKRLRKGVKRRYHFHALAGLKIGMINHVLCPDKKGDRLLLRRKMRMYNMGGGDVQTFAGAFSTGTHGSGGTYTAYHDTVRSIEMVASGGRAYRIEPNDGITDPAKHKAYYKAHPEEVEVELIQDDDKFYSAVLSMGCFGVVYSVIMEIADFSYLHEELVYTEGGWNKKLIGSFAKPKLPKDPKDEVFYQIQLNPYKMKGEKRHSVMVKTAVKVSSQGKGKKMTHRKFWPTVFANSGLSAKLIRVLANTGKKPKRGLIETALKRQNDNENSGGGYTDLPYKIWDAGSGKLKSLGTAIEFAFPTEKIPKVMETFLPMLEQLGKKKQGYYLNVPVAFRFVRPSKSYLGPNYYLNADGSEVKEWCYIEVLRVNSGKEDMDKNELEIYTHLQTMFTIQGGRPHWGLNFNYPFTIQGLKRFYPQFDKWHAAYRYFNASGVFQNRLTRETGLDGSPASLA